MLLEPLDLGACRLRNRIVMSPMSQRSATPDGLPTDWHLVHYGSRAAGGCGLVLLEDTAVHPLGRTGVASLGLYDKRQADALARIVRFCQDQGAAVGIQLAHAGRKALSETRGGEGTIGASADAFAPGWISPQAADEHAIAGVVDCFAAATTLASSAGFDAVEVHAGHGFLLHQFLSPIVNRREDRYGGSVEGRAKLLLEVVEVVRANWPPGRPLLVRLPAGDGAKGGASIADMVEVATRCSELGADLIDISGGSPLFRGEPAQPQEMLDFSLALNEDPTPSSILTAIGGGIDSGASAERLLRDARASLVTVGRPLLRNPCWALAAAEELQATATQG
jgi:2,4-dienoyl-CoA reductase-like NADH-dependent reductase (Old Yellow Enzyme family)